MNQTPAENPLVSIIVRTKDRPKLLNRALKSIFEQTYRPIEVVLVNDGGCDLDIEEIRGILSNVSLNYLRLEKNMGRAHAGNVGIANAKGEYIGFLDDDDEYLPEHIETLVFFLVNSGYKVAYSDSLMLYEKDETFGAVSDYKKEELVFSHDFDYSLLLFENYIPFMCLLFERDVIIESEGLDTHFTLYEDWDLLIRIGERYPFHHIKKVTAYYRQWNPQQQISQSNQNPSFLRASYISILSKHMGKLTPEHIHNYMIRHSSLKGELHMLKTEYSHNLLLKEKINYLEAIITEKDERLTALSLNITEKNAKLSSLDELLAQKEALLVAMINTKGWRLLESYRKIRNAFSIKVPPSVKENLFIKGIRVFKNQGLGALIQKINKKFLFNRTIKTSTLPISIDNSIVSTKNDIIETIESRVSVIIPTRNAGDEFDYTLRRIKQQAGIREIEIIIVDSGSKDKTLEIAEKYSSAIFQISPQDFHHAKTRNYGVEKATGEYIVFTVQDAIPIGNNWLYKLLMPIYSGSVSATSAIQIPRSDSDLFSLWSYWAHYIKFLRRESDCIYRGSNFQDFDKLNERDKRLLASLDNVSLGIRKKIFNLYQFHTDYAEDLELGVRMIKDGHSLMFQSSNAVIHSHNRSPFYYLKRSYLDRISVCSILGIKRNNIPAKTLLEANSFAYGLLKLCLHSLKKEAYKPGNAIFSLISNIYFQSSKYDYLSSSLMGDTQLDSFFLSEPSIKHGPIVRDILEILAENLKSFAEYVSIFDSLEWAERDLTQSIYKIFSNMAGSFIAANTKDNIEDLKGGV